ncbi:MAG: AI-2E family transporter [Thermoleophilia bacterium]
MQITIPRWAQLIVIPVAILLGVYFARMMSHALFVFLMASLLALLLNPLAKMLTRVRVPRAVGVPVLYLALLTIAGVIVAIGVPPLVRQAQGLVERAPEWASAINQALPDYQAYLERQGIFLDIVGLADSAVGWLGGASFQSVGRLFNFGVGLAGSMATLLLVLIVSFYMLIDARRINAALAHLFPIDDAVAAVYFGGLQMSFTRFVKGQAVLALAVGLAAGLGVWILGWDVVGVWPEGAQYALLFGFWAGVTEVIPYVGPWLGALPPIILALFHSPITALWVAVLFWLIQLLENHILVPNIMGASVGVHPLVVIFALLAGAEVGGILGMLAVLPLLAMVRHTLDFFDVTFSRASWIADDQVVSAVIPAPPRKQGALPHVAEGALPHVAGAPGSGDAAHGAGEAEPAVSDDALS